MCLVIFIFKLKCGKRKVRLLSLLEENKQSLTPSENPINIRFRSLIGSGSFGVVWKASFEDQSLVAVKMCSADRVERWEKEKAILTSRGLVHTNIIKMIGWEVRNIKAQTALLLIFEFVEKGDLRSHLTQNTLSAESMMFLVKSLCSGVAFLHSSRDCHGEYKTPIAHRDMKSSNVLFSESRGCIIADFGLAVSLEKSNMASWLENKVQVGELIRVSFSKLHLTMI